MPGVMDAVRAANRTRRPEDSVTLRAVVLAAVITGALALAVERAISPVTAGLVVVALCVAYWVSHVRRTHDNWHIKIALTLLALVALFRFFGQLRAITTLDEVRFPLADLFLWIQVLHGFDLPARKDLNFSLGSSLTLMAAAGSISQDLWFGILLVVYFVLATIALSLVYRSELEEGVAGVFRPPRKPSAIGARAVGGRDLARAIAVTVVAATLLFLVIPQPQAVRTFALPFAVGGGVGIDAGGGIANPGFPQGGSPGSRASGSAYYGFADRMDLTVRGDLSDDVVMRVRASAPAMWRGMLFDRYDGTSWTGDESDPETIVGEPPYAYPLEHRSLGPRATVTQTFYIETEQPSVVFAAGQPDSVWIEGGVSVDELGALRPA